MKKKILIVFLSVGVMFFVSLVFFDANPFCTYKYLSDDGKGITFPLSNTYDINDLYEKARRRGYLALWDTEYFATGDRLESFPKEVQDLVAEGMLIVREGRKGKIVLWQKTVYINDRKSGIYFSLKYLPYDKTTMLQQEMSISASEAGCRTPNWRLSLKLASLLRELEIENDWISSQTWHRKFINSFIFL